MSGEICMLRILYDEIIEPIDPPGDPTLRWVLGIVAAGAAITAVVIVLLSKKKKKGGQ